MIAFFLRWVASEGAMVTLPGSSPGAGAAGIAVVNGGRQEGRARAGGPLSVGGELVARGLPGSGFGVRV